MTDAFIGNDISAFFLPLVKTHIHTSKLNGALLSTSISQDASLIEPDVDSSHPDLHSNGSLFYSLGSEQELDDLCWCQLVMAVIEPSCQSLLGL